MNTAQQGALQTKFIYKFTNYTSFYENDADWVFVETEMEVEKFIETLAAIHLIFRKLADFTDGMNEQHLLYILENFYGARDVSNEYSEYLPYMILEKDEWDLVNKFNINHLSVPVTVIQIDWFEAVKLCMSNGVLDKDFSKIMEMYTPNTIEFQGAIKNPQNFYPEVDVDDLLMLNTGGLK